MHYAHTQVCRCAHSRAEGGPQLHHQQHLGDSAFGEASFYFSAAADTQDRRTYVSVVRLGQAGVHSTARQFRAPPGKGGCVLMLWKRLPRLERALCVHSVIILPTRCMFGLCAPRRKGGCLCFVKRREKAAETNGRVLCARIIVRMLRTCCMFALRCATLIASLPLCSSFQPTTAADAAEGAAKVKPKLRVVRPQGAAQKKPRKPIVMQWEDKLFGRGSSPSHTTEDVESAGGDGEGEGIGEADVVPDDNTESEGEDKEEGEGGAEGNGAGEEGAQTVSAAALSRLSLAGDDVRLEPSGHAAEASDEEQKTSGEDAGEGDKTATRRKGGWNLVDGVRVRGAMTSGCPCMWIVCAIYCPLFARMHTH